RLDGPVKVLVNRAERVCWLPLEHVIGNKLRTLSPVIKRDQSQGHCPVCGVRTILQPPFLIALLIVAQPGNNLPDLIKIVPPILSEQSYPAVEKTVKEPTVPRAVGNARSLEGLCILFVPTTKVGPAISAICNGG